MDEKSLDRDNENNIGSDQALPDSMGDVSKTKQEVESEAPTVSMDTSEPVCDEQPAVAVAQVLTDIVEATTQSSLNESVDTEIPLEASSLTPELVNIKIIYSKKKYDHSIDINNTILQLKQDIEGLTGVPVATQKVMFKGSTKDSQTLKQLKVSKTSNKFMVVGSTVNDLLKVAAPDPKSLSSDKAESSAATSKEPLCKQTAHKKVLDKHGKPDDSTVGLKGTQLSLPPTPLTGMYNKYGGKTRLTFKLDTDELWIGTKERTQKVKMGSIKDITSQPIEGHEEYHIMGIQLGTTEASKYWIYWVPAQYINAIKDTVLGKWGDF